LAADSEDTTKARQKTQLSAKTGVAAKNQAPGLPEKLESPLSLVDYR
jgi:hypothetical protein